mmetsp:Transcript_35166/g.83417  ORF Transcript_35166/g.83417 Transcript_35166/m.83417 type:complete len:333 (-) Transcript_35166:495-1493(-)
MAAPIILDHNQERQSSPCDREQTWHDVTGVRGTRRRERAKLQLPHIRPALVGQFRALVFWDLRIILQLPTVVSEVDHVLQHEPVAALEPRVLAHRRDPREVHLYVLLCVRLVDVRPDSREQLAEALDVLGVGRLNRDELQEALVHDGFLQHALFVELPDELHVAEHSLTRLEVLLALPGLLRLLAFLSVLCHRLADFAAVGRAVPLLLLSHGLHRHISALKLLLALVEEDPAEGDFLRVVLRVRELGQLLADRLAEARVKLTEHRLRERPVEDLLDEALQGRRGLNLDLEELWGKPPKVVMGELVEEAPVGLLALLLLGVLGQGHPRSVGVG